MLEAVIAIGDAELGCGNAELAVFGRDANIRQHRHLHAAAETETPDTGDGRFRIIGQQRALRSTLLRIFFRGFGVVAGFFFVWGFCAPGQTPRVPAPPLSRAPPPAPPPLPP